MEIPHTTRVNSMPSDKKQGSVSLPALHAAVTKEELLLLNKAAKKAALSGNRELTEEYRKKGVSLDIIGRAVGLSGNWDYAEYLLEQNPQSLTLATGIIINLFSCLLGLKSVCQYSYNPKSSNVSSSRNPSVSK